MDKKEIARQAKFVNEMAKGRKSVVKGKVIGGGIINQEFSMLEDIDKAISESESAIGELENELAEEKQRAATGTFGTSAVKINPSINVEL